MKKRLSAPLIALAILLSAQALLFSTNTLADSQPTPDIVIREMDDKTLYEYRVNGYLYAVKVVPDSGKPYYLVAEDGGDFSRVGEPGNDKPKILIPRWKILEW